MKRLAQVLSSIVALGITLSLTGCTINKGELGSEKNPIKLFFVPSVDTKVIEENSKLFKAHLEKETGYKFKVEIPHSFIAVVEAFGSKQADVASINTFGYILAHDKYGAEARLTVLRHGLATYQAQFLAKADGPIKSLADFNGKKMAFVDPSSASGFLLPKKVLNDKGIKPAEEVFAMKHDSVVSMIYQGQVDGGATFYSPEHEGKIQDARRLVKTQYPDVEQKIKIVELTEAIPNDPIIFRKELTEEMKKKITDAFVSFVATPEGKATFEKVYGVTDLKVATDADYEPVRVMLKSIGKTADELLKK
ncbi:MAG: phosphate/phosphite/phosphonate ABC transporter substrate-binding protein [Pseudobdellovibrionaceae bacterium]|jgi:phosphonate transport system substrate-binding protein